MSAFTPALQIKSKVVSQSKGTDAPASAEQRRQIALAIAQQCTQILQQDFGVDQVIVFGSLRGDTPWHCQSDLDLAVQGLSKECLLEAHRRLETIVPHWLPIDLVAIEWADPRVRDRILQLTPMPDHPYLALKIRLEDEIATIARVINILQEALAQANTASPILLTPALASYTENFYSGCEKLAERIAVELDGGLPSGSNWHEQLLLQMSESGGQGRPPLFEQSLTRSLGEYRRFRHRVRHLYNFDLDDQKVLTMAQQVPATFAEIQQAVEVFGGWLVQQAKR